MDWHSNEIEGLIRRALDEDVEGPAIYLPGDDPRSSECAGSDQSRRAPLVCAGLPIVERAFRVLDPRWKLNSWLKTGLGPRSSGSDAPKRTRARNPDGRAHRPEFSGALERNRDADEAIRRAARRNNAKSPRYAKDDPRVRMPEKYAVRMGGGTNHRFGLYDAILLKEITSRWLAE